VYTRRVRGEENVHPVPSELAVVQSPTAYAATVVPSTQAGTTSVYWVASAVMGVDVYEEET